MPNWKKLVVSGSDAHLNSLNVATSVTSSFFKGDGSAITNITASYFGAGLVTASNDFSQVTFTKDGGDTFLLDTTPNHIHELVKSKEAFLMVKGTPVYVSGSTGNASHVYAASASRADRMPAAYVLDEDLVFDQEGYALLSGFINNVNTSQFAAGDSVYVGASGGYTNVKPTGSNLIQKLGNVIKVDASNGSGVITGAGRANDVPNIPENYLWIGNADGVATPVSTGSLSGSFLLNTTDIFTGTLTVEGKVYQTGLGSSSYFGFEAGLNDDFTANRNTGFGYQALKTNTSGFYNTAVGHNSLIGNTSGERNTAIGFLTLAFVTTGDRNTALGYEAGTWTPSFDLPNSSNSIYIGAFTQPSDVSNTNEIILGYDTIGKGSNTTVIGNSNITHTYLAGIITGSSLDVTGNITVGGTVDGIDLQAFSSSIEQRATDLEAFSSSLDATFATDADLNLISASVDALNAATSSYALEANISGAFTSVSESIASDIAEIIDGTQTVTSASYALTASYALNVPVTASYAFTASYIDPTFISASAAEAGFGAGGGGGTGDGFPYAGDAVITGSLLVSGSVVDFTDAIAISGSSFSGSFQGDGSGLTNISGISADPFPYTGSALISGSLEVTGSLSILSGSISLRDDYRNIIIGSGSSADNDQPYTADNIIIGRNINPTSNTTVKDENVIIGNNIRFPRGNNNTFIGHGIRSIGGDFISFSNTVIGHEAAKSLGGGDSNVIIGNSAGTDSTALTNGDANTFVGAFTKAPDGNSNVQSSIVIGYGAKSKGDNTTYIGTPGTTTHTYLEGLITGSSLEIGGTITATSIVETSALRFKTNIQPLESQLDNIYKLNPVSFDWKQDNKSDIGFIAEEVSEVYPNLVHYEDDQIKGINYSKLTAVLVKALQDQQKQIDKLKQEILIFKQQ